MRTLKIVTNYVITIVFVLLVIGIFLYIEFFYKSKLSLNIYNEGSLASDGCVSVSVDPIKNAYEYSFDGGLTWQKSNYGVFYENGTKTVMARNSKGDTIAKTEIEIDSIIDGSPVIMLDQDKKVFSKESILQGVTAKGEGLDLSAYLEAKVTEEKGSYIVVNYSVYDLSGRSCILVSKLDKE